jgi:hypothetical protein
MGHLPEIMRIEVNHHMPTTLAQAFSIEQQIAGGIIGAASWKIARQALKPQVEGAEHFTVAKKHLAENGSVILYANDPLEKKSVPATAKVVEDHLTSLDHLAVFVSRRQVDKKLGLPNRLQHYFLIDLWGISPGVKMIPITQKKDRERYLDWAEFNAAAEKTANEFVNAPRGGNVFMVTPGGERSPQLQKAKIGFAALFRATKEKAMVMPLAVPNKANKVIAGPPITWKESLEDQERNPGMRLKERLMARLARITPPEERGDYAQAALDFRMPPITA